MDIWRTMTNCICFGWEYKNLHVTTCFWSPTNPLSFKLWARNCFVTLTFGKGLDCSLENKSSLFTKHQTSCQVSHQIGVLHLMSHLIFWDHYAFKGGLHNNFVARFVLYQECYIDRSPWWSNLLRWGKSLFEREVARSNWVTLPLLKRKWR
jgi:hypothetical protein